MHSIPNLETIIQYALLRAGEGDDYAARKLGPIHLIKYVYLADLYHSEKFGETFTGIKWQFYNFGPWSTVAHSTIDSALTKIMANKTCLESMYSKDDWTRWELRDSDLLRRKSRDIPPVITSKLSNDIRKFNSNTADLLDYVYKTEPMLNARPNDILKFEKIEKVITENDAPKKTISNKKAKKLKQKIADLRQANMSNSRKNKLVSPVKNSRLDEVYFEGVSWLDKLAGEEKLDDEIVVEFSDLIWDSNTRKNYDIS